MFIIMFSWVYNPLLYDNEPFISTEGAGPVPRGRRVSTVAQNRQKNSKCRETPSFSGWGVFSWLQDATYTHWSFKFLGKSVIWLNSFRVLNCKCWTFSRPFPLGQLESISGLQNVRRQTFAEKLTKICAFYCVRFCFDKTCILQCCRCALWVWLFDPPDSAQLKDIKHINLKLYH